MHFVGFSFFLSFFLLSIVGNREKFYASKILKLDGWFVYTLLVFELRLCKRVM